MEHLDTWRRRIIMGALAGLVTSNPPNSVAKILEGNSLIVSKSGKDLWELHNDTYKAFLDEIESLLAKKSVRIRKFFGFINRDSHGIYTLRYSIEYHGVSGNEPPHKHVELMSSVWREAGVGKIKAKSNNKEKVDFYSIKWRNSFNGVSTINHESWDESLYQVATLYLAEGRRK